MSNSDKEKLIRINAALDGKVIRSCGWLFNGCKGTPSGRYFIGGIPTNIYQPCTRHISQFGSWDEVEVE